MKDSKGFTLIELLICIVLLSVVIIFMFRLMGDIQNEENNTPYIHEIYAKRNEVLNYIGEIAYQYGICSSDTSESNDEKAIINLSVCNGKNLILTVDSKSVQIDYDDESKYYDFSEDGAWIDVNFTETSDVYQKYEYYSLTFPTHKKGIKDTVIDDIGIYYGVVRDEDTAVIVNSKDCTFDDGNGCLITVDRTGTYRLEAWGGKGSDNTSESGLTAKGGLGGYTYGELSLKEGDLLYIGLSKGGVSTNTSSYGYGAPGGDGVFFAFNKLGNGYLTDYENNKDEIILVAGGGGGASSCLNSTTDEQGMADRYEYSSGKNANGSIKTSSLFGVGSACNNGNWCGGTGGGGYFGGGSHEATFYTCSYGNNRPGGEGGSGYINTHVLKNAVMYAGVGNEKNTIETMTLSSECEGYSKSKCLNTGGPYARLSISIID